MRHVRLSLAKDLTRHLRGGHPWVFRKALEPPPSLPAGAIVDVVRGARFVARGYWDPASPIAVRVLTLDESERVDLEFFRRRLRGALEHRRRFFPGPDTDAYRLVNGEGDFLPGVVADRYGAFVVLKLYSAGLTPHRQAFVDALRAEAPWLRGIVGRDEVGRDDGGDEGAVSGKVLWGEAPPDLLQIVENGARFRVDVYRGQKTGFFLDQRDNRLVVRGLASGLEVLNCFSYSGGFSVSAARGGALRTTSVDTDQDALALARQNLAANGLDLAAHELLAADVFDALSAFKSHGRGFDFVILDPPAFAKSARTVEAALNGYASLNRAALAVVRDGGLLATASCSARVSSEQFLDAIRQASSKARKNLVFVTERFQPPDHPIPLAFPEGKYLKFYVFRVWRGMSETSLPSSSS